MRRFEYMTIEGAQRWNEAGMPNGLKPITVDVLDEYGKAGWEVVAVEGVTNEGVLSALLKREL